MSTLVNVKTNNIFLTLPHMDQIWNSVFLFTGIYLEHT